jgi:hypothetical protein
MATIGSDPEVLVRSRDTGAYVPMCGLIGGTKRRPVPMVGLEKGYALQEDNVMLEFNIPAASSINHFDVHIERAFKYVCDVVEQIGGGRLEVATNCTGLYSADVLTTSKSRQFGCSPDFDAHDRGEPLRPPCPADFRRGEGELRFAGGHVHLGYDNVSSIPDYVVAALADLMIGLPSIGVDSQADRRAWYGTAGRYRPTSYGIEYRSLSNFWLFDAACTRDVGSRALRLCGALENPRLVNLIRTIYNSMPWADVIHAINTENVELAADLVTYFEHDLGGTNI